MDNLFHDFQVALRTLSKDRRFALTAIVALVLGIGSTTVIFSLVYNLVLDPFPYRDSSRLVTFAIHNLTNVGGSSGRNFFWVPEFVAFREQNHVFEDMVGYTSNGDFLYNDGTGTRTFAGAYVTTNTFEFYGVRPLLGRGITPEDGKPDAPPVFVMSYGLWHREFNSDAKLLGTTFVLDGVPRTLVGVMPPRCTVYRAGIWVPQDPSTGSLQIVGRLKPGVSLQAAAADLNVIVHRLPQAKDGPFSFKQYAIVPNTLVDVVLGSFKKTLYALLAAVLMLLLIACTNVANLLLARATVREKEIAVRAALGASRGRLVRQLLVESFVLSMAASIIGCALAYFGLKLIAGIIPSGTVPAESVIALNPAVLSFALGITVLTTFICGLAPALHVARGDLQPQLTGSGKNTSESFRHGKLRASLVIVEVALSIVLLIGAGLMMRSFFALTHVDLPFNPANTLYARLSFPRDRYYSTPDRKPEFFQQVLPRVQALPGVISTAESLMLPPNEGSWTDVTIPGKPHAERWTTDIELCTAGYFQTLGLQLLRGRLFSQSDVDLARHVAVVNQTLSRQYFGSDDPIGQKIKFEVFDRPFLAAPHNTYFEIIGVVADFKTRPEGTQYTLRPDAFLPASVAGFGHPVTLLVKTAVDPNSLLKSVYREVWAVDPDVAFISSGSIEGFLKDEFKEPRFELATFSAFAATGLTLVIIGIFSVMAYTVSLQTHEIGVRMALGAQQNDILRMVLRKGLKLITVGVVIGVGASLELTRFLASQIWGISVTDPWTFGAVVTVVVAVGTLACFLPARGAAHVDPMIALHYE
jgi:putative ABC transport system permease protein